MANDDYQYQPRPLPVFATIGIESLSAAQVAPTHVGGPNVDTPWLDSPFSNSDFTGGGGGGGDLPTCADERTIGTIRTNEVGLPCSGAIQVLLSDSGLEATSGSKTLLIELDGSNNQIFISTATKSVRIDPDDLNAEAPDASFKELDVCVNGAPGKRMFLCSDGYES